MSRCSARCELMEANPGLRAQSLERMGDLERTLAEALAARSGVDLDADLRPFVIAGAVCTAMRVAIDRWGDVGRPGRPHGHGRAGARPARRRPRPLHLTAGPGDRRRPHGRPPATSVAFPACRATTITTRGAGRDDRDPGRAPSGARPRARRQRRAARGADRRRGRVRVARAPRRLRAPRHRRRRARARARRADARARVRRRARTTYGWERAEVLAALAERGAARGRVGVDHLGGDRPVLGSRARSTAWASPSSARSGSS